MAMVQVDPEFLFCLMSVSVLAGAHEPHVRRPSPGTGKQEQLKLLPLLHVL